MGKIPGLWNSGLFAVSSSMSNGANFRISASVYSPVAPGVNSSWAQEVGPGGCFPVGSIETREQADASQIAQMERVAQITQITRIPRMQQIASDRIGSRSPWWRVFK